MDRRTVSGALLGIILSGGIAAVIGATALQTGSPYFDLLIYGGAAAILGGGIGLLCLWWTAPKMAPPPSPQLSTTFKIRNGGRIKVADVTSTADSLLDAEGYDEISVKNASHSPPTAGGGSDHHARPKPKRSWNWRFWR